MASGYTWHIAASQGSDGSETVHDRLTDGASSVLQFSDQPHKLRVGELKEDDSVWLAGAYGANGIPSTRKGWAGAKYANNRDMQFWPTRRVDAPSSAVGGSVPSATTRCETKDMSDNLCPPPSVKSDGIIKVKFRPQMSTIASLVRLNRSECNGGCWFNHASSAVGDGLACVFSLGFASSSCRSMSITPPQPADVVAADIDSYTSRYHVYQNFPCLKASGDKDMYSCIPCEQNGQERNRCLVVASNIAQTVREVKAKIDADQAAADAAQQLVREAKEATEAAKAPGATQAMKTAAAAKTTAAVAAATAAPGPQSMHDVYWITSKKLRDGGYALDADHKKRIVRMFPCPLGTLAHQIGEAVVPFNIMAANTEAGGARDIPTGNFYTCEYHANAIQNVGHLREWVDGFLGGEVAPCCSSGPEPDGNDPPRPCWYRNAQLPVPFLRGMPDDAAAVMIKNFAARTRLRPAGTFCAPERDQILAEVTRAKNGVIDGSVHSLSMAALQELEDTVRDMDTTIRHCTVKMAQDRAGNFVPDWSKWSSLGSDPQEGGCSIVRTTSNPRLECGGGMQVSRLTVEQQPYCGGDPCPPLERYRFCTKICAGPDYPNQDRELCTRRCQAKEERDYNLCFAMSRSDQMCRTLGASERERCVRRCASVHRDYECSSNLCLTPGRIDPVTNRRMTTADR